MKTITISIPQSDNKKHGFHGTIHKNKRHAWTTAVAAFHKATGVSPAAIAVWLDSSRGRHFADGVNETVWNLRKDPDVIDKTGYAVRLEVKRLLRGDSHSRGFDAKADFIETANSWYAEELTQKFPPKPAVITHTFEKGEWVQRASA